MTSARTHPGSFRDPGGHVVLLEDRVYRTVNPPAANDFDFVDTSGLADDLIRRGWLIESRRVDAATLGDAAGPARYVVEHPRLAIVSHPYEWPFTALKAAALLHLDVHLRALAFGGTMVDGSAYNVQLIGALPVLIDRLSLVRYRPGAIWAGHRQFCEQFLNPLLLTAYLGVPYQDWYRGAPQGIPSAALRRLLPLRNKLRPGVLAHVVLHSSLQASARTVDPAVERPLVASGLPRAALERMLRRLRRWIAGLEPRGLRRTTWSDYARTHGYGDSGLAAKRAFVVEQIAGLRARSVWDLGCNTGDYAFAALEAGAAHVVGFDADHGALELAFRRAAEHGAPFTPLHLDLANPSPDQGWAQAERAGLMARAHADCLLALALVHHLAIGQNVPLPRVLDWLTGLAPTGIIEFVPKADPMVRRLLSFRDDIFPDYGEEAFLAALGARARIVAERRVTDSGRLLVAFDRRP